MLRKTGYALVASLILIGAAFAASDKMHAQDGNVAGLVARHGHVEKAKASDFAVPDIERGSIIAPAQSISPLPRQHDGMEVHGHYIVTAMDSHGRVKWSESFDNLVTTVGKNDTLDHELAGSSWTTGTVYMLLKGTGTAAAGDTMSSHAGWSELNASASSGARQAVTFSAASSGSKATSSAVAWSITGTATVAGVAIVIGGTSTNGNTTGVLFSVGDFGSSRSVQNGDTLNVTYSTSL
jgi:hypothetical protein